jgi:hypothetical protein
MARQKLLQPDTTDQTLGPQLAPRGPLLTLSALALLLGLALPGRAAQLPACFLERRHHDRAPVSIEAPQVRTEGPLVWVLLAYHNPTATPLHIGLQQWANACTQLVDDVHNTYTLLQTVGMGFGYDPRYWLTLAPEGHATVVFLFRAEAPAATPPTRYTLRSEQFWRGDETTPITAFTVAFPDLVPH